MDSETALMLIVIFGTVAIGCTLVVLKTWVLRRRLHPNAGRWSMLSGFLLLVTFLVAANGFAEHERAAEQARVDRMRGFIAPVLERYRSEHGMYPPKLETAGIPAPMTRYGRLYYYSSGSKREPWYLLSFGDIQKDRFSSDWDSRSGKWTVVELDF
jgi:hypothetical protein